MPPKVRYDRDSVLNAAFRITREKRLAALNARAIAKELGCSTQPLFRDFSCMEDIRREMLRMAEEIYNEYIRGSAALDEHPYKGTGMAYILFAKDEPELFKLLFMRDRTCDSSAADAGAASMDYVLDALQQSIQLDREQALIFHRELWIFTHGLAVMIATKYIAYDEPLIRQLLTDQFLAMRRLFKERSHD